METIQKLINPIEPIPLGTIEKERLERIHTAVIQNAFNASIAVAEEIAELIQIKASERKPCVLGLATGSSPTSVYDELIRMHKEEGLIFKNVHTFRLKK